MPHRAPEALYLIVLTRWWPTPGRGLLGSGTESPTWAPTTPDHWCAFDTSGKNMNPGGGNGTDDDWPRHNDPPGTNRSVSRQGATNCTQIANRQCRCGAVYLRPTQQMLSSGHFVEYFMVLEGMVGVGVMAGGTGQGGVMEVIRVAMGSGFLRGMG